MRTKNAKKIVAAFSAAVLSCATVMTAFADSDSGSYNLRINNEYCNVNVVDENGNAVDGIKLKMQDGSGNDYASWTSGEEYNAILGTGIANWSRDELGNAPDLSHIYGRRTIPLGDIFGDDKNFIDKYKIVKDGFEPVNYTPYSGEEESEEYNFKANSEFTIRGMLNNNDLETEFSLPAGQARVFVDEKYGDKSIKKNVGHIGFFEQEYTESGGIIIGPSGDFIRYDIFESLDEFKNGKQITVGDRDMLFTDFDEPLYSSTIIMNFSTNKACEYAKMKINLAEFSSDSIEYSNSTGGMVQVHTDVDDEDDEIINFDLKQDTDNQQSYIYFVSGKVVTYAIPDENGDVEIYVNRDDYKVYSKSVFFVKDARKDYGEIKDRDFSAIAHYYDIDTNITIPETGFTFVGLSSGEEVKISLDDDNSDYIIDDVSYTLTDSKEVQNIVVTVRNSSSSSSSSEVESSSSSSSSSDVESSSSGADSSSEISSLPSSSDNSEISSSSAASSSSSSSTNNSSKAAAKNDSNPSTGVASDVAVLSVLCGLVLITLKFKADKKF